MTTIEPEFEKMKAFIEKLDWQGLAETWHKSDVNWHAEEWRKFIEYIGSQRESALKERIGSLIERTPEEAYALNQKIGEPIRGNAYQHDKGYIKAISDVLALLEEDNSTMG